MERERQGERERYRDRARESERESAKYITVRAIRMLNQLNVMRSETEKRNVSTKKSHLALAQKKLEQVGGIEKWCACVWGGRRGSGRPTCTILHAQSADMHSACIEGTKEQPDSSLPCPSLPVLTPHSAA